MDKTIVLKIIINRLALNKEITDLNVKIFNFIPADATPPFIDINVLSWQENPAYKTISARVQMNVISAYQGDLENTLIVDVLMDQLIRTPFLSINGNFMIQGRLQRDDIQSKNHDAMRQRSLEIMFFLTPQ